jgi:hypothetical protein
MLNEFGSVMRIPDFIMRLRVSGWRRTAQFFQAFFDAIYDFLARFGLPKLSKQPPQKNNRKGEGGQDAKAD